LSKPIGDEAIPERKLEYIREKLKSDLHDLVLEVFVESGITQATLAKRLKKDRGQVSRTLGSPGNWTFDTLADYIFAIDGKLLKPDVIDSVCTAKRNMKIRDIATELFAPENATTNDKSNVIFVHSGPIFRSSASK